MMELRQNKAAKATCTGRIGTSTPMKLGSVSNETHPSTPEVSTKAPSGRSSSLRSAATPINVRPPKNRTHHQFPTLANAKKVRLANAQKVCLKPTASKTAWMVPSIVPRQPTKNPARPA